MKRRSWTFVAIFVWTIVAVELFWLIQETNKIEKYQTATLVGLPELEYLEPVDPAIEVNAAAQLLSVVDYLSLEGYVLPEGTRIVVGFDRELIMRATERLSTSGRSENAWSNEEIRGLTLSGQEPGQVVIIIDGTEGWYQLDAAWRTKILTHELIHASQRHLSCGNMAAPGYMIEGEAYLLQDLVNSQLEGSFPKKQTTWRELLETSQYQDWILNLKTWEKPLIEEMSTGRVSGDGVPTAEAFAVFLLLEAPSVEASSLEVFHLYWRSLCAGEASPVAFEKAFGWTEAEAFVQYNKWLEEGN